HPEEVHGRRGPRLAGARGDREGAPQAGEEGELIAPPGNQAGRKGRGAAEEPDLEQLRIADPGRPHGRTRSTADAVLTLIGFPPGAERVRAGRRPPSAPPGGSISGARSDPRASPPGRARDAVDRRLVPPVEVDHVAEEAMGQVGGEETISAGGITSPSRR